MAKIIFTKGASTFTFSVARIFPVTDPYKVNVVTELTDGGQMYAYNKGITERNFVLEFARLSAADNTNLLDWFLNVAVGPLNEFTFTDEDGVDHTVRWMDTEYPIERGENDIRSGTIHLREEV